MEKTVRKSGTDGGFEKRKCGSESVLSRAESRETSSSSEVSSGEEGKSNGCDSSVLLGWPIKNAAEFKKIGSGDTRSGEKVILEVAKLKKMGSMLFFLLNIDLTHFQSFRMLESPFLKLFKSAGSLAFNIVAPIDDLYVDDLTRQSEKLSPVINFPIIPHKKASVQHSVPVSGTPLKSTFSTQSFSPGAPLVSPASW